MTRQLNKKDLDLRTLSFSWFLCPNEYGRPTLTLIITNGTQATLFPSLPTDKQQIKSHNHLQIPFKRILIQSPPPIPLVVVAFCLHNHQFGCNTIPVFLSPTPSYFLNCTSTTQSIHCQSKSNNYNFAIFSNAKLYNNIQTNFLSCSQEYQLPTPNYCNTLPQQPWSTPSFLHY